jgi:hypothetical protein
LFDADQGKAPLGALAKGDARKEGVMSRLMMILYSMIGTALAGSAVVVALVTGNDTLQPILIAAACGAVLALPVSWWVARQIA